MKSSTLQRAGLSRENMSVLENCATLDSDRSEYTRYVKPQAKTPELDMLWRSVGKTADIRNIKQKAPGVYLLIGFIAGALFMGIISLIAGFANLAGNTRVEEFPTEKRAQVAVIAPDGETTNPNVTTTTTEEKYEVKSGDTLDSIVYRFYGRYDTEVIQKIQDLNNLSNPNALQIGQVLVIPVEQTR